jgi:hypothetical protein
VELHDHRPSIRFFSFITGEGLTGNVPQAANKFILHQACPLLKFRARFPRLTGGFCFL